METKEGLHAYEDAQKMSKDPTIVAAYKDHLAWINDETSIRATDIVLAERRGMEKGIEKGIEKGNGKGDRKRGGIS